MTENCKPAPLTNIIIQKPKLWIISFGHEGAYFSLAQKTVTELLKLYPDAVSKIYNAKDLPDAIQTYAALYHRGFGYWQWKAWLVKNTMSLMEKNDILLYVDGRCGVGSDSIEWLDNLLEEDPRHPKCTDIVAWQYEAEERSRSTADVMAEFNISLESDEARSGQFAATFFAIRVNEKTSELVDRWYYILTERSELCRDNPSHLPNHNTFRENRYDQSVLSLLLKTYSRSGLTVRILSNEVVLHNNSLSPWGKTHPADFSSRMMKSNPNNYISYIKTLISSGFKILKDEGFLKLVKKSIRFLSGKMLPDNHEK
jgi:hypothetical protein